MFHSRQDVRSCSWSALIDRFSGLPHVPRISRDLSYCSSLPRQHIVHAPYVAMRSLCRHGTHYNIKSEHLSSRQQIPGRHDNKPIDVSRRPEGYVPACASLQHCYTTADDSTKEVSINQPLLAYRTAVIVAPHKTSSTY